MLRLIILLVTIGLLSCGEKSHEEFLRDLNVTETSAGKQGVGTVERPVDKELYGIRFQQKGLELKDAWSETNTGRMFCNGDSILATDTIHLPLLIRGWHAPNGVARFKYSSKLRKPDGSVAEHYSGFKEISRINVKAGEGVEDLMYFSGLDTTVAFYDCEFNITDQGNGRSLTGTYRVCLK